MSEIQSTQITTVKQALVEIDSSNKRLLTAIEETKDTPLVINNATEKAKVHSAWNRFYRERLGVEKTCKGVYDDMREQLKSFKSKSDQIASDWKAHEDKYKAILKAEEDRKEAEKAAKVQAEKARIDIIRCKMIALKNVPINEVHSDSSRLKSVIDDLEAEEIDEHSWQEFQEEALMAKDSVLSSLYTMHQSKLEAEKIAKQQAEEAARLAEERRLFEEQQAKAKAKQDERDRAERKRLDDERKAFEAEQAALKAQRDAEEAERQAVIKAQQDEIDGQRKELEAKKFEADRIERERIEAEELAKKEAEIKAELEAEEKARLARMAEEDQAEDMLIKVLEQMSVKEAFKAIRSIATDQRILAICNVQIAINK